jgi:hypothetical protein
MRKYLGRTVLAFTLALMAQMPAHSETFQIDGLKLKSIRYVGQYAAPEFRDTIELWFTTPLTFPSGSNCTSTFRVFINATHRHLVAGAQVALAMNRTINIAVDNTLPIRDSACEVVYLDVPAA